MLSTYFPESLYLSSGFYGGLIIIEAFPENGMKFASSLVDHKGWGKTH